MIPKIESSQSYMELSAFGLQRTNFYSLPLSSMFISNMPSQPNTNLQTFIILFSLSYCIYDLVACIYYRLSDMSLISHHLFCILGFGFAAWTGYGAIDGIGGLFVAEVSNFYMHLRIILRTFNRKNTKAY